MNWSYLREMVEGGEIDPSRAAASAAASVKDEKEQLDRQLRLFIQWLNEYLK